LDVSSACGQLQGIKTNNTPSSIRGINKQKDTFSTFQLLQVEKSVI